MLPHLFSSMTQLIATQSARRQRLGMAEIDRGGNGQREDHTSACSEAGSCTAAVRAVLWPSSQRSGDMSLICGPRPCRLGYLSPLLRLAQMSQHAPCRQAIILATTHC